MNKIINWTFGIIYGIIFAMAILLVLTIFFVVLIPFIFYFTVKEVLKSLTKTK